MAIKAADPFPAHLFLRLAPCTHLCLLNNCSPGPILASQGPLECLQGSTQVLPITSLLHTELTLQIPDLRHHSTASQSSQASDLDSPVSAAPYLLRKSAALGLQFCLPKRRLRGHGLRNLVQLPL
jgi:hypothetical protein